MSMKAMAIFPLLFFLGIAWRHRRAGRWGDALWMCHLSNLALAGGIFFNSNVAVYAALPWLLFGIPLWVAEAVRTRRVVPLSVVTHAGGAGLGVYAAIGMGPPESATWWISWMFALGAQGLCRWITRPEWNVNVSHRVYDAWKPFFKSYFQFWLFCIGAAAGILYGMDTALGCLFRPG